MKAFIVLLFAALAACPLWAEEAALPQGASLLPEDTLGAFKATGNFANNLKCQKVPVTGQPFKEALHVETLRKGEGSMWSAQLQLHVADRVGEGDVVFLSFRMRALKAANEESAGLTQVAFEESSTSNKSINRQVSAGREWRIFHYHGRVGKLNAAKAEGFDLNFQLNVPPQVIEIADVRLLNLGPDADTAKLPVTKVTYEGREPDAKWRAEAAERIEKHRKANLSIRVTGENGQPAAGAKVEVRMGRHAFLWGTDAANLLLYGDKYPKGRFSEADTQRYREQLLRWFNQISPGNGLKEKYGWEEPGEENSNPIIPGLQWAKENRLSVYGHWLILGVGYVATETVNAAQAPFSKDINIRDNPETYKQRFYDMVRRKVRATRGLVDSWDITHPVAKWGRIRMEDVYGTEMYSDLIRIAREEVPGIPVYVNESSILSGGKVGGQTRKDYPEFIRMLARQGTPASGISFQAHFETGTLTAPADVYAIMEEYYREFKVPLRLTELDIDAEKDEELQADYLRDILTVAFSHPAIECVTQWGFWEGLHWKPNRALIRKDWTLKPAGKVYEDLVFKQWWTNTDGATGADGAFKTRGFLGDYEITAELNGKRETVKATLKSGGNEVEIKLKD